MGTRFEPRDLQGDSLYELFEKYQWYYMKDKYKGLI